MTFALTSAYLYKVDTPTHIRKWGCQAVELVITRESGDTALDLGDIAGTFWTAVGSSALGARVLPLWTQLLGNIESLVSCELTASNGFLLRAATAAAATNYALANSGTFPDVKPSITLNTNAAPATVKVTMVLALDAETRPVEFGV